jgi:hypothetical protein
MSYLLLDSIAPRHPSVENFGGERRISHHADSQLDTRGTGHYERVLRPLHLKAMVKMIVPLNSMFPSALKCVRDAAFYRPFIEPKSPAVRHRTEQTPVSGVFRLQPIVRLGATPLMHNIGSASGYRPNSPIDKPTAIASRRARHREKPEG